MKLKTKFQDEDFNLGEVVNANIYYGGSDRIKIVATSKRGGEHSFYYESLKELNEMFEDYEEPKSKIEDIRLNDMISGRHIVEIDFTEVEEAKKAMDKLRAWERLKDKGFRFEGWEDLQAEMGIDDLMLFNRDVINTDNVIGFRMDDYHDCIKDLNTCFGGEE